MATQTDQTDSSKPLPKLSQPLQFVKGVGPNRAVLLEKLGLRTAADLLFYFPRSYQDFTKLDRIADLEASQDANILGTVCDIDQMVSGNGTHILYVLIAQERTFLRGVWFNQPYMTQKFNIGQRVLFRGRAKLSGGRFQMNHPNVTWLDSDQNVEDHVQLTPIYALTDGISQRQMRTIIGGAVQTYTPLVQEAFPDQLRDRLDVCGIADALYQIHSPRNQEEVEEAKSRLVYQELFILQLAIAIRRNRIRTQNVSPSLEMTPKIQSRILGRLPFDLTETQMQALKEIATDMGQSYPMNRLIHGEVGSGKTVVALAAMLVAVAHGYQATIMAPTEILARQHYQSFQQLLKNSRVRLGLWTGSIKAKTRREQAALVEAGEIDIVVGTHAVVASELKFARLGLVVIDEQHKFGVKQRALLKQSGHDPHYLVMTATPIPRTISMTLFGDLDTSVLQRTSGVGQKVHTYLGQEHRREQWWEFVRKKVREGRQAFVVAPLVDGGEDSELQSAERVFEALSNGPFSDFRLDVLHGKQSPEEKDAAMENFVSGKTQIMIATGVIEVGINVPNATVMTIESAERFGLSQLHQLRGRVSRGHHPGFVCAFSTKDNPEENERLKAFAETDSGFELAEVDLKIRGPGNLFSTQQSGFPPLMIADLIRDADVVARAQIDARELIESDPEMLRPELQRLRQLVWSRYGNALELSDVG